MILSENIDLKHPEKFYLSIRIHQDSFAFTLYDDEQSECFDYYEIKFSKDLGLLGNVQQIIFENNFLNYEYKQVNVIYVTSEYELVPELVFERKSMHQLYNFTHLCPDQTKVMCGERMLQSNHLLYAIDRDTHKFIVRSLINPVFYHHTELLLPYFGAKTNTVDSNSQMCLNFHDNMLDVYCFTDAKIYQMITYSDPVDSDVIYYVLNLWEKCMFNQIDDNLLIFSSGYGDISEIVSVLKKYIKNVFHLNLPSDVQFLSEKAEQVPLDLLMLAL